FLYKAEPMAMGTVADFGNFFTHWSYCFSNAGLSTVTALIYVSCSGRLSGYFSMAFRICASSFLSTFGGSVFESWAVSNAGQRSIIPNKKPYVLDFRVFIIVGF